MQSNTIPFRFSHPLKHKVVRDLKIVTEQVGDVEVVGTGHFNPSASRIDIFDRYAVDVEAILWKGVDVMPVLEVCGGLEDILEAAIRHTASKFENTQPYDKAP